MLQVRQYQLRQRRYAVGNEGLNFNYRYTEVVRRHRSERDKLHQPERYNQRQRRPVEQFRRSKGCEWSDVPDRHWFDKVRLKE